MSLEEELAGFQPIRIMELELSEPLPGIPPVQSITDRRYDRAQILVRLHRHPVGLVRTALPATGIRPAMLADTIWAQLADEINTHLFQDGLDRITELGPEGLPPKSVPGCVLERQRTLAEAPLISVLVATHERTDTLSLTLESLLSLEYPRYEILVIDNAPRSKTTQQLVEGEFGASDRIHYRREDRKGLAWALNRGIAEACGEIVALADDDVVVDPHWLTEIANAFRLVDRVACVTGLVLPYELENGAQNWFEENVGFGRGTETRIYDLKEYRPRKITYPFPYSVGPIGKIMALRTSVVRALGGFDVALGVGTPSQGGEDLRMLFELLHSGYRVVYAGGALEYHKHRHEYGQLRRQVYAYGAGLTAYLTSLLRTHPETKRELSRQVPLAIRHIVRVRSLAKNAAGQQSPRTLRNANIRGMLAGPALYLLSQRVQHRIEEKFGRLDLGATATDTAGTNSDDRANRNAVPTAEDGQVWVTDSAPIESETASEAHGISIPPRMETIPPAAITQVIREAPGSVPEVAVADAMAPVIKEADSDGASLHTPDLLTDFRPATDLTSDCLVPTVEEFIPDFATNAVTIDAPNMVVPAADVLVAEAAAQTDESRALESGMPTPSRPHPVAVIVPTLLIAGAVYAWIRSLHGVNLNQIGEIGLVSVLPDWFYVALALLTLSFAITVVLARPPRILLLTQVTLLLLIFHATPSILYPTVRYGWAYKHVGVVNFLIHHRAIHPLLDAYQDWPGFFAFGAFLTREAGLRTALQYANWAPPFFELLTVCALLFIYQSFTTDTRLIWLAIWIFALGNWVGQDYFSPQAFDYFLYLIVIGVVLRWFAHHPDQPGLLSMLLRKRPDVAPAALNSSRFHGGLMAAIVVMLLVIVASHQLTPFMMIGALTALFLTGVLRQWRLPLLVAVMTTGWILYMGAPYIHANLQGLLASFGQVGGNLKAGLGPIETVPAAQRFVATVGVAMTAFIIVVPVIGVARRYRAGYRDIAAVALAMSPVVWIVTTRYGHEILLRVFLFALPFAAFLTAAAIFPSIRTRRPMSSAVLITAMSLLLAAGLCITYYGKEQMNYMPPDEVSAVQYFDRAAPRGSLLVEGASSNPLPYRKYAQYKYLSIADLPGPEQLKVIRRPVVMMLRWMRPYHHAYFLVTETEIAETHLLGDLPPNAINNILASVTASPRFVVRFRSQHAILVQRRS